MAKRIVISDGSFLKNGKPKKHFSDKVATARCNGCACPRWYILFYLGEIMAVCSKCGNVEGLKNIPKKEFVKDLDAQRAEMAGMDKHKMGAGLQ